MPEDRKPPQNPPAPAAVRAQPRPQNKENSKFDYPDKRGNSNPVPKSWETNRRF